MKHSISKKLFLAFAGAAFSLGVSFSAMAATPEGTLEGADSSCVYGWVWDSDSYGHVIPVEISIYSPDSSEPLKTAKVKADHYQEKLQQSIGDGYHGFKCSMDWDQFDQDDLRVTACAVTEDEQVFLGELTYQKSSDQFVLSSGDSKDNSPKETSAPQSLGDRDTAPQGPGEISVSRQAPGQDSSSSKDDTLKNSVSTAAFGQNPDGAKDVSKVPEQSADRSQNASKASAESSGTASDKVLLSWQKGPGFAVKEETKPQPVPVSLGMFTVTGYCSCDICCPSSISNLTYSGTQPQPEHTVSADIDIFPIGTRLMIGDIIYTVEDIGSKVVENKIDIYYATHEEALAHGTTTEEVFSISE